MGAARGRRRDLSAVSASGIDHLHIASEGRDWHETSQIAPGLTITQLAREVSGLPVIANGGMHDPAQASQVLERGHADLVSLERGALANPDWVRRLHDGRALDDFDGAMLHPSASIYNQDDWRAGRPNPVT